MAVAEQVVSIDSASSLIEQLAGHFVIWKLSRVLLKTMFSGWKLKSTSATLRQWEAAVAAKEQDLLDQIQEVKDAAVAAIAEARAKYQPTTSEPVDDVDNNETKVSSSLGDTNELLTASEEKSPRKTGENVEGIPVEVKPRAELTQFCEQMDAKGLLNFTMENRKNLSAIREELSVALESAMEPARLVLDSLEGSTLLIKPPNKGQEGCCPSGHAPILSYQAKAIADEWKPKLAGAGIDAANGNSLEAEAFLKLLATFRIASEFDEEELCKLVLAVLAAGRHLSSAVLLG
ncbi:FRIGIDA-like protein 3 [Vitis vinifera]|uniref:FRIGIDA-like protein n=1 Tax=Vitis vinifera TaxID=29760 RepID=A0A438KQP2_VITVI|nr:FRIGIDA-like protein 3 [Vitis vinifera]